MEKYTNFLKTVACLGFLLLNIDLTKGTVQITTSGTPYIGQLFTMTCTITPFSGTANWAKNGTTVSTCSTSFCAPSALDNATFSYNASGISVTINPVSISDSGSWECTHPTGSETEVLQPTIFIFVVTVILALLTIGALSLKSVYGLLIANGTVAQCVLHCLRYYNRKKGISPVSPMKLFAKRGDKVVLKIDGLEIIDFDCQRCPGIIEPNFISGKDEFSCSNSITSDDDYGVYQVDILIDCSQIQSDAKYNYYVISESATTKNDDKKAIPESATKTDDQKAIPESATKTDDQKGRECTFLVKFQWDKEDLVSIQYPAAYFFADKYFLNGVKFKGIQIIIGAAIIQLIALIAVSIVLLVVYFGYKKYDICIGVAVSCALAIAFSLLGLTVYLLTVVFICRRKLKSKGGKGQRRCGRKFLLFIMLPVALLVMIGIFIVNKCRGGKDECGNEEQGTKEEISMRKDECGNEEQGTKEEISMSTGKKGRLPPITATINGTDEQNERIRKKKKPKKDKKAKQITNSPENIIHPMEIQNAEQLSEEIVQPCITDLK